MSLEKVPIKSPREKYWGWGDHAARLGMKVRMKWPNQMYSFSEASVDIHTEVRDKRLCFSAYPQRGFDAFAQAIPRMAPCGAFSYHRGCVNSIRWNRDGTLLVSGSDDTTIGLWKIIRAPICEEYISIIHSARTGHTGNIFDARIRPYCSDEEVITCAADGEIRHVQLERASNSILSDSETALAPRTEVVVNQRSVDAQGYAPAMVYHVDFVPHCYTTVAASCQNGTLTQYDIRNPSCVTKIFDARLRLSNPSGESGVTCFSFNPYNSTQLLVACDLGVHLLDTRKPRRLVRSYKPEPVASLRGSFEHASTGLAFSPTGKEFAYSVSGHGIFVVKINPELNRFPGKKDASYTRAYDLPFAGHLNVKTFLKGVEYVGSEGKYITAGSDCGNVFIWSRQTGRVASILPGDTHVVNMVSPHPNEALIASCGIESTVKIFAPQNSFCTRESIDSQLYENLETLKSKSDLNDYKNYMRKLVPQIRLRSKAYSTATADVYPTYPDDIPTVQGKSLNEKQVHFAIEQCKRRGNELFQTANYAHASRKYEKGWRYVDYGLRNNMESDKLRALYVALLLNEALSQMRQSHYDAATISLSKCLEFEPKSIKGKYRRAQCYLKLGELQKAREDIDGALLQAPEDVEIRSLRESIVSALHTETAEERKKYSKLFS